MSAYQRTVTWPLAGVRVLVVGAGIIGRSTAYFLARQGAQVVLLDEGIPTGSPTSRASLGVLTHCNGGDNPYAQLFPRRSRFAHPAGPAT